MIEDRDLVEFRQALMTGVTAGIGALILLFSSGAQIIVQCPFECVEGGITKFGHGEDVNTSPALFSFLNRRVSDAALNDESVLTLNFDRGSLLTIVPDKNGLESFVISTRYGIYPIIVT